MDDLAVAAGEGGEGMTGEVAVLGAGMHPWGLSLIHI